MFSLPPASPAQAWHQPGPRQQQAGAGEGRNELLHRHAGHVSRNHDHELRTPLCTRSICSSVAREISASSSADTSYSSWRLHQW